MALSLSKDTQEELERVRKQCPQCLNMVQDEEQFLTCHGCFEDVHCLCFNDPINTEAYIILKEELSSVFIFCPPCKAKFFAHDIFDKPISPDYGNRLESLETQMSRLITVLTESSSQTHLPATVLSRTHPNHSVSTFKHKSRVKEQDFGLALSGHDQLKHAGQGNRSPLHKDNKTPHSGSPRGSIRSPPLKATGKNFRPQPYPVPRVSAYRVDPVKATEALKGCCFRKPKDSRN